MRALQWNFLTDSKAEKEWRVILSCLIDSDPREQQVLEEKRKAEENKRVAGMLRPLEFDEKAHLVLCEELKHLYTAMTRARVRVIMYEEDEAKRAPMYYFLQRKELCEIISMLSQTFSCDSFARKTSREEWRQQGENLRNVRLYKLASKCFEKSGDEQLMLQSQAEHLLSTVAAKSSADEKKRAQMEAGYLCLKIGGTFLLRAAKSFAEAGEFETAGDVYELCALQMPKKEALRRRCVALYRKAGKMDKAADVMIKHGDARNALTLLLREKRYEKAIKLHEEHSLQGMPDALSKDSFLRLRANHLALSAKNVALNEEQRDRSYQAFLKTAAKMTENLEEAVLIENACYAELADRLDSREKFREAAMVYTQAGDLDRALLSISKCDSSTFSEMQVKADLQLLKALESEDRSSKCQHLSAALKTFSDMFDLSKKKKQEENGEFVKLRIIFTKIQLLENGQMCKISNEWLADTTLRCFWDLTTTKLELQTCTEKFLDDKKRSGTLLRKVYQIFIDVAHLSNELSSKQDRKLLNVQHKHLEQLFGMQRSVNDLTASKVQQRLIRRSLVVSEEICLFPIDSYTDVLNPDVLYKSIKTHLLKAARDVLEPLTDLASRYQSAESFKALKVSGVCLWLSSLLCSQVLSSQGDRRTAAGERMRRSMKAYEGRLVQWHLGLNLFAPVHTLRRLLPTFISAPEYMRMKTTIELFLNDMMQDHLKGVRAAAVSSLNDVKHQFSRCVLLLDSLEIKLASTPLAALQKDMCLLDWTISKQRRNATLLTQCQVLRALSTCTLAQLPIQIWQILADTLALFCFAVNLDVLRGEQKDDTCNEVSQRSVLLPLLYRLPYKDMRVENLQHEASRQLMKETLDLSLQILERACEASKFPNDLIKTSIVDFLASALVNIAHSQPEPVNLWASEIHRVHRVMQTMGPARGGGDMPSFEVFDKEKFQQVQRSMSVQFKFATLLITSASVCSSKAWERLSPASQDRIEEAASANAGPKEEDKQRLAGVLLAATLRLRERNAFLTAVQERRSASAAAAAAAAAAAQHTCDAQEG